MGIEFNFIFNYNLPSNVTYLYSPEALKESSIFLEKSLEDSIRIVAHRGDSDDAPENTIPALEYALENGYSTAECDVSWTKDEIPVLLHDETINRTGRNSNGTSLLGKRKVASYDFEQLKCFDFGSWFGPEFKGTKIPSLEEALSFAKENDLELYLDLKNNINLDDDKIEILAKMVQDLDMEDKVSWISFNYENLQKIAKVLPDARLGYLTDKQISDKTINMLKGLKTDTNDVFLDIKYTKVNDNGISKLDKAGFYFEAWTVDSSKEYKKLIKEGCKGITTNVINRK